MINTSTKYKAASGEDVVSYINRSGKIEIPLDIGLNIDKISIGIGIKSLGLKTEHKQTLNEYTRCKELGRLLKHDKPILISYFEYLRNGHGYAKEYICFKYNNYNIKRSTLALTIDSLVSFINETEKDKNLFLLLNMVHGNWEYNIVISRAVRPSDSNIPYSIYCYGGLKGRISGNDPQFLRDIKRLINNEAERNINWEGNRNIVWEGDV